MASKEDAALQSWVVLVLLPWTSCSHHTQLWYHQPSGHPYPLLPVSSQFPSFFYLNSAIMDHFRYAAKSLLNMVRGLTAPVQTGMEAKQFQFTCFTSIERTLTKCCVSSLRTRCITDKWCALDSAASTLQFIISWVSYCSLMLFFHFYFTRNLPFFPRWLFKCELNLLSK